MEFSVTTDFADAGEHIRQEGSSSKLADKCGLGVLKRGDGVLAADRGKILEEFVQSVSCFEVVQESLKGDPRAPEYGCAMKDIRVLDDDITDRSHG